MIKHVLVATDGSDKAREAVAMAAHLAKPVEARLTILHVILHGPKAAETSRFFQRERLAHPQATMPSFSRPTDELFQVSQGDIGQIVSVLGDGIVEEAANEARSLGVGHVDARVEPGEYAETILAIAEEIGADMIVVGSRGLGRFRGMLLGSVSRKITQRAHCSVMVVR
ncbi:universal stress protein [Sinorhizobium fredii]|uniref:universal stress protein n=1 Tax=Rhizobium fredii TaxID=380 RepID=UPI000595685D|nr:universal stress protein [Sinorhizobium fredii]WOS65406.1 universal stress protein [Sinorhizobium fredii GR64]